MATSEFRVDSPTDSNLHLIAGVLLRSYIVHYIFLRWFALLKSLTYWCFCRVVRNYDCLATSVALQLSLSTIFLAYSDKSLLDCGTPGLIVLLIHIDISQCSLYGFSPWKIPFKLEKDFIIIVFDDLDLLLCIRFQVKKKQFFRNFMTITLFGAVGTLISFTIISIGNTPNM